MRHLEMIESVADATATANDEARMTNDETNPKSEIQNGPQGRGYNKNICGRHGRLYTSHEV